LSPALSELERVQRTERFISFIRLGVVLFNVATYLAFAEHGSRHTYALAMCVIATVYAFATLLAPVSPDNSMRFALGNMILDNFFIAVWVFVTGGFASPYYLLIYAEAAASVGRFGVLWGGLSALGSGVVYAAAVLLDGRVDGFVLSVRLAYVFFVSAFVAYVVDLARRSERDMVQAEAQAAAYQELDSLRSTFVTNISHELRTPLTVIRGAASTLVGRGDGLTASDARQLVEMIDRHAGRLGELVEDIIDVGMTEQGELMAAPVHTDLVALVVKEVGEIRYLGLQNVALVAPDGPLEVVCDPLKIGNAIRKLLNNAVKFSAIDSTITVSVEPGTDEVVIRVTDEGIGIDPGYQRQIFERFYQVDPSHTRAAEGAGVGLFVAQAIMRAHGGRVDVSSTPGRGSEFTLHLPWAGARPAEGRLTDSRPA
jgi:signal transduction histidine kinase